MILAGRDLERGGTWLGITKSGKIGALTNYRDAEGKIPSLRSRGEILAKFFDNNVGCSKFLSDLSIRKDQYQGFNLLIGENDSLYYFSNRNDQCEKLQPGIYGLSNHLLNTAWPKVERGKQLFVDVLKNQHFQFEELFNLLGDTKKPVDEDLPQTGVGLEWERLLSTIFISGSTYGTRSSAIVAVTEGGVIQFYERTYSHNTPELKTVNQKCLTVMRSDG